MKRSGDCEDYAIAKFFVLRDLGYTGEQLRIVILMDRIRRVGHAVLAVYALGDILILDSLTDLIFRSDEHTSELQSLMRISYDVFCLKKNNTTMRIEDIQ